MAQSEKYQDWLIDHLQNGDEAAAYLKVALEESCSEDMETQYICLQAFKQLIEAYESLFLDTHTN